jgi:hypothetical protein
MTKRRIVTFSRRTDAGLWVDFLLDKVHRGGTYVPNPMTRNPYWVSLMPDHVALLNLWTKAPNLLLRDLDVLKDTYELAFFVTQTGCAGTWLEPNVPRVEIVTDAVTKIANATGGSLNRMWWRYDTIVTTDRQFTREWHVENFGRLCGLWKGLTERVIISKVHLDGAYASIRKTLDASASANGDQLRDLTYDEFIELAVMMKKIAREHGIELEVCCSPAIKSTDCEQHGIRNGACLSRQELTKVDRRLSVIQTHKSQRSGSTKHGYAPCHCVESVDIGAKQTCGHGCVYCYANRSGKITTNIAADSPWLSAAPLAESTKV